MSFFENTRKPVGLGGKIMVVMMNFGHSAMAEWGLRFLQPAPDAKVLDCGCGGGANIKRSGCWHRLWFGWVAFHSGFASLTSAASCSASA